MRRIALAGIAVAVVGFLLIELWLCRWHSQGLKRVAVSYTEKFEDKTIGRSKDFEYVEKDSSLYAEEQLSTLVTHNRNCMVLTHDGGKADYHLTIGVTRFVGDPATYGEANLSITRTNGDVVLSEHFFQDRNSTEDIRQQPITRAWKELCATETK